MMHRAYSILETKSVNIDDRIIEGVATTPSIDRVGDQINSRGIKYRNPLPCLLHHDATKPVGKMYFSDPTDAGVKFRAHLPNIQEPGVLRDRVQEAWDSVRYGLIAGASIGFRTLGKDSYERMEGGGTLFKEVEVLEVSLVCVPANQDCTISAVRSLYEKSLTALSARDARPPAIIDRALAERRRRAGLPNSQLGTKGVRHSVRIIS